jgi:hypothetical protein
MKSSPLAIGAGVALALSLLAGGAAMAQDDMGTAKAPMTGSIKPKASDGPAVEKSLPSSAPTATTTATTGATNQSNTVKAMNSDAKAKVEVEGK